jgi:hypothetical protein
MTTGALIFAFNNSDIDYVAMARWSARNIHRHLKIPVSIVTDAPVTPGTEFDSVIQTAAQLGGTRYFDDIGHTVPWYNAGRANAYALSPYDQTLVLDADYVVASSALGKVLAAPCNFMCHRKAYDLVTTKFLSELNQFGEHNMPMWWATVMMFRKSDTAQYIFDCMQMVQDNWQHYQSLYGIQKSTYRNDFALSIALGIVSGQTNKVDEIPWPLATVVPKVTVTQLNSDRYKLEYQDSNSQNRYMSFMELDFHAMGKQHLGAIVASN